MPIAPAGVLISAIVDVERNSPVNLIHEQFPAVQALKLFPRGAHLAVARKRVAARLNRPLDRRIDSVRVIVNVALADFPKLDLILIVERKDKAAFHAFECAGKNLQHLHTRPDTFPYRGNAS